MYSTPTDKKPAPYQSPSGSCRKSHFFPGLRFHEHAQLVAAVAAAGFVAFAATVAVVVVAAAVDVSAQMGYGLVLLQTFLMDASSQDA